MWLIDQFAVLLKPNDVYVNKNIRYWFEAESCCFCTVDNTNINFTNNNINTIRTSVPKYGKEIGHESEGWRLKIFLGRDIFCLETSTLSQEHPFLRRQRMLLPAHSQHSTLCQLHKNVYDKYMWSNEASIFHHTYVFSVKQIHSILKRLKYLQLLQFHYTFRNTRGYKIQNLLNSLWFMCIVDALTKLENNIKTS